MRSPAGVSSRPAHDRFVASLVRSSLLSPPVTSMCANRRPGPVKIPRRPGQPHYT